MSVPTPRWPAEWEPHEGTLLSWPHNTHTWPDCLEPAQRAYAAMVRELSCREAVHVNVVDTAMEEDARKILQAAGVELAGGHLHFHHIPTNDAWIRDHGPIAVQGREALELLDFGFNAWGEKYPPWELDDAVPGALARELALPCRSVDFILEGGSIDGNGEGVVLTTESCLLNPNRGPGRTRARMEAMLSRQLGAGQVIWLRGGIEGDDTDGHIDDIARFVGPRTIVAAVEKKGSEDPNAAILAENRRRLVDARDAQGRSFEVVELPMPPSRSWQGFRCPASYANFYIANGVVLVPVFQVAEDERALAILKELFQGRDVVGVPCAELVVGLGAVHCLTLQLPRHPGRE